MSEILASLNQEQLAAVTCTQGPMLIVAGAGSGKTRVLTSRIAYLIEQGVPPERILALTFTKKAAGEMKDRIALMVGERKARRLWMGTFHSVFIRFLRDYAGWLGFPSTFTIYDTTDSVNAIKSVIKQLNLDDKVYKPKEILARISRAKNALVTPTPYMSGIGGYRESDRIHKTPEVYRIYSEYCRVCKQSGVMDFDDILLYMNILLRDNVDACEDISSRFDHILVDEYQDTNMAQYVILKKLSSKHHNLCVVGDDSQSIYGFRGAEIQNILSFTKDFPEAKIFRLERNYRSTRTIVNAANAVIAKNEGRIPKQCVSMGEEGEKIHVLKTYSDKDEAIEIASGILDRMRSDRAQYSDFAIMYRTNAQSSILEEQLRRRNIPYMVYSGKSFYDKLEVKDMLSYFKLAVNHNDDEAFRRVVNKPTRGIGDTSVGALSSAANKNQISLFNAAFLPDLESYGLKGSAIAKIRAFCSMMSSFNALEGDAYDVALSISSESGLYLHYKSDTSIEGMSRFECVQQLLDNVKGFVEDVQGNYVNELLEDGKIQDPTDVSDSELPNVTLSDYLENISLLTNNDVSDDEISNKVALMTVHTAKGLEFPYVYIAGMEENIFPSGGWMLTPKDLEEERRLFYVALTRAKNVLTVSFAQSRIRNGKHESNSPSRFLREIAPQYLDNPLRRNDFEHPSVMEEEPKGFGYSGGGVRWRKPDMEGSGKGGRFPGASAISSATGNLSPSREPINRPVIPEKPAVIDPNFVPDPMSTFNSGDQIEHNRFGKGVIIEITGVIPDLKAKVRFDQFGEKILLLKFAKLRHI